MGFTAFLTPVLLSDKEHPKSKYRQAGAGHIALSVWLMAIVLTTNALFLGGQVEENVWLTGLVLFAIPIIALLAGAIGLYYLAVGIFAPGKSSRPALQSAYSADPADVALYVRRLTRCTVLNLLSILVCIALEIVEAVSGVGLTGLVGIIQIALLIAFTLTAWRLHTYLVKASRVMGLFWNRWLLLMPLGALAVPLSWVGAVRIIRKFKRDAGKE